MIGILERRRGAMTQQAAPPSPVITGLVWDIGKTLSSRGATINNEGAARTASPPLPTVGAAVKFTGAARYNGASLTIHIHEYDIDGEWAKRTAMQPNVTVELTSETAGIRFAVSFGSGTGLEMTQAIVDECFSAEWV